MQKRFRRSELEPRGPKSGPKTRPRSSRRVRSAALFTKIPNPPTKAGLRGMRRRDVVKSQTP
eukprot:15443319-Alexandrium_andersonii.AAC.1